MTSTASRQRLAVNGWMSLAPFRDAVSLGVLRIAVGVASMGTGFTWLAFDHASLPRDLWRLPVGSGWAADVLPVSPGIHSAAIWVFIVAALGVTIGLWGRQAALIAVLVGLYAGWVPQLTGKVDHYHHVIWFLALLVLVPCNDRLAVRVSGKVAPQERYAAAGIAGVILIGVIYLSAGLPKIESGFEWAFSDNMRNIIWNLSWEKQFTPLLPVDQWPIVYQTMAFFALLFELFFLPAALYPRTRVWVRWIGLGFHLGIWAILGINFWSLMLLYVVFFDWSWLRPLAKPQAVEQRPLVRISTAAPVAYAISLSVLILIPGNGEGWPISGYPTFSGIVAPVYVDFVLHSESGTTEFLSRSGLADAYGTHHVGFIAQTAMGRDEERLLLDHIADIESRPKDFYTSLEFYRVSTEPGQRPETRSP